MQSKTCLSEVVKCFKTFLERKRNLIKETKKKKTTSQRKPQLCGLDGIWIQTLLKGFPVDSQSWKMTLWETRLATIKHHSKPSLRNTPSRSKHLHLLCRVQKEIAYSAARTMQRHIKKCLAIIRVNKCTLQPVWGDLTGSKSSTFAPRPWWRNTLWGTM